jgi:hypothetical protein
MGKASREKGSRVERELAAIVGGKRNPAFSGKADVENNCFVFEVKVRKWPKWMCEDYDAARIKAIGTGKGACVAWKCSVKGQSPRWVIGHAGADEWQSEHGNIVQPGV